VLPSKCCRKGELGALPPALARDDDDSGADVANSILTQEDAKEKTVINKNVYSDWIM